MENFVVSARKYRPSSFETVIGQEHITNTLKNAIKQNQLAHAFLFCGPRGVGKTTCARIFAKTINCLNITPEGEACNECDSCKAFNSNASFNIYELDAASNNSVEDIRALVDQVRYPPQSAKFKIYIIDEVHMLSSQAFNAFLKTLEEPPSYAKFILATTERHKILPTILSRCQVFDFRRIQVEDAVKQLQLICERESVQADEEALHVIARKSDGAMRDALSIFDRIVSFTGKKVTYNDVIENLNILDYEYYFKAVEMVLKEDVPAVFLLFDEILNKGFDAQHFLAGFHDHIRDLLVCKYPDTLKLLEVATNVKDHFIKQASASPVALLMNALNLLNKCELEYRSCRNGRLHVELTLMKLCHIKAMMDLSQEQTAKKKIPELTPSPESVKSKAPEMEITVSVHEIAPAASEPPSPMVTKLPGESPFKKNQNSEVVQSKLDKLRQMNPPAKDSIQEETKEESLELPVDAKSLEQVIQNYIARLESEGKISLSVIYKVAGIQLLPENEIEFTFSNKHESEMFSEDKINILPYLRKSLNNVKMNTIIKVMEQKESRKIFTVEEKFNAMAERNPVLIELKNALGLELEY